MGGTFLTEIRSKHVGRRLVTPARDHHSSASGTGFCFAVKSSNRFFIIDYLQLMRGRTGSEWCEQEISEISRFLKALAKELNIPVVAISQLNRAPEARENNRPRLADLRESGAIE